MLLPYLLSFGIQRGQARQLDLGERLKGGKIGPVGGGFFVGIQRLQKITLQIDLLVPIGANLVDEFARENGEGSRIRAVSGEKLRMEQVLSPVGSGVSAESTAMPFKRRRWAGERPSL